MLDGSGRELNNAVPAAALPTLDIGEGALDKLFSIYKALLPGMGGYLTEAGSLHKGRLQMVLNQMAELEQETLEERAAVSLFEEVSARLVWGLKQGILSAGLADHCKCCSLFQMPGV